METEIQNKHREKKSFKKEIRQKCILLKSNLGIVVFNALLHHLNNFIKGNILQYCYVIIKN